jgi:transposase
MPKKLEITLSAEQLAELEALRDHDPRPYLRERAAAILKIAAGQSGREIALHGLLRQRWPDAVYRWFKRYQEQGPKGLEITPGAGRKPAFSPSVH